MQDIREQCFQLHHVGGDKSSEYFITNSIVDKYGVVLLENYTLIYSYIMSYINRRSDGLVGRNIGKRVLFTESDENEFYKACGVDKNELKKIILQSPNFPAKSISDQTNVFYNLCLTMMNLYYRNSLKLKSLLIPTLFDIFSYIEPYSLIETFLAIRVYSKVQCYMFKFEPTGINSDIMEYTINNLSKRFELSETKNVYDIIKRYGESNRESMEFDYSAIPDEKIFGYISKMKIRFKNFFYSFNKVYKENRELKKTSVVQKLESTNNEGDIYLSDINNVSNNIDVTINKIYNRFVQDTVLDPTLVSFSANKTKCSKKTVIELISSMKDSKDNNTLKRIFVDIISYWFVSKRQTINNIHSKPFAITCMNGYNVSNTKDVFLLDLKKSINELLIESNVEYKNITRQATLSKYKQAIAVYMILYIMKNA